MPHLDIWPDDVVAADVEVLVHNGQVDAIKAILSCPGPVGPVPLGAAEQQVIHRCVEALDVLLCSGTLHRIHNLSACNLLLQWHVCMQGLPQ